MNAITADSDGAGGETTFGFSGLLEVSEEGAEAGVGAATEGGDGIGEGVEVVPSGEVPSPGVEAGFYFDVYSDGAFNFRNKFGEWLTEPFAEMPDVSAELLKAGVSGG